MHQTIWNPRDAGVSGYWGAATASIDWCELNYQYTFYLAELFNSLSNAGFVALAGIGIYRDLQQELPRRFLLAHLGLVTIGAGSFLFHSTLLWELQLLDELPMIYVSSIFTFIVFDLSPIIPNVRSKSATGLAIFLVFFDIFFTFAYLSFPNPIFHQVCYATLVLLTTIRGAWILYYKQDLANPKAARVIHGTGVFSLLWAFFIWNLDNLFCLACTKLKENIGLPFNILLEGHAWWHLFSGLGVYLIITAVAISTLSIRDQKNEYELQYTLGLLPWVAKVEKGRKVE